MTDDDEATLDAFENGTMALDGFGHKEHVRLAWLFVRRTPMTEALERFTAGLRRLASRAGKPGLYHETVTWALMLVIHERLVRGGETSFEEFETNNPDLFQWPSPVLEQYYTPELISSDLARKTFVLPDRLLRHDQLPR